MWHSYISAYALILLSLRPTSTFEVQRAMDRRDDELRRLCDVWGEPAISARRLLACRARPEPYARRTTPAGGSGGTGRANGGSCHKRSR